MRDPNLIVTKEPAPEGVEWYQVQDVRNEFHLWIVQHNPQNDALTCTCESAWCDHKGAVADELLAEGAAQEAADALAYSRGQF